MPRHEFEQNKDDIYSAAAVLIKSYEKFSEKAYFDYKQHSIGWGRKATAEEVKYKKVVTKDKEMEYLYSEIDMRIKGIFNIISNLSSKIQDYVIRAIVPLTSFTYNVGLGGFKNWVTKFEPDLSNLENREEAFLAYNKVSVRGRKVVNKGLARRRSGELTLVVFSQHVYINPAIISSLTKNGERSIYA